jgi:predicted small lipoprotein YifL
MNKMFRSYFVMALLSVALFGCGPGEGPGPTDPQPANAQTTQADPQQAAAESAASKTAQ